MNLFFLAVFHLSLFPGLPILAMLPAVQRILCFIITEVKSNQINGVLLMFCLTAVVFQFDLWCPFVALETSIICLHSCINTVYISFVKPVLPKIWLISFLYFYNS